MHVLYDGMVTHFECQGAEAATIEVSSGIRQGCPFSGAWFALLADLFVCRFQAHAMFMNAKTCFVGQCCRHRCDADSGDVGWARRRPPALGCRQICSIGGPEVVDRILHRAMQIDQRHI